MIIDETTYALPSDNYLTLENQKKQIIIGHTFNHDMKHYTGWLHRYHGKYKRTTPYTIASNGLIYKHFNPKYESIYFKNKELDNKSIVILLENDGWLLKDSKKDEYISWSGCIYREPREVVEKRWRGFMYWSPYSKEQMESAIKLIKMLCVEFNIPSKSISHNTKVDDLIGYEGVLYKSNLDKHYTDLNPTWSFEEFKIKIETN